jgi:hypothetical protein
MFGKLPENLTIFKARIKKRLFRFSLGVKAYFKHFIHPIYLFPIKIVTYTAYYLTALVLKLIIKILKLIWFCISWPFRKWLNFGKTIFWILLTSYLLVMTYVILVVIAQQFGSLSKLFCFGDVRINSIKTKVVRIVGTYGQGSGFFISGNQVLTNFHVIDGEANPKIVLQGRGIIEVEKMVGDKAADLAILTTKDNFPDYVIPIQTGVISLTQGEPLYSIGFPEGTDIKGEATVLKGQFANFRDINYFSSKYIQVNLAVVPGMSGGPLVESCGSVVGINQLGLSGLSLFIASTDAYDDIPGMTDKDIRKVELHPEASPADAVYAFYTYIGARNMKEGFNLLSGTYLQKTNFEEWTARFNNILNVVIYKSEAVPGSRDTVSVKFTTDNWVNNDMETHYYEGTWQTIKEGGVYKMLKSKIVEVENPGWDWFLPSTP